MCEQLWCLGSDSLGHDSEMYLRMLKIYKGVSLSSISWGRGKRLVTEKRKELSCDKL